MDSAQVLHQFWSGFGWKAYDANSAISASFEPEMPMITYEVGLTEFNTTLVLSASLWEKSYSWANITQKADEIFNYIGLGGKVIPYNDGYIWIKRGVPFYQRMADEDDSIRRIYINTEVEFFTGR